MPFIQHLLNGSTIGHYPLADSITIGRSSNNQIVLDDATVSAHHAVIEKHEDGYQVRDLNSTNGVLVNGKRLELSPLGTSDTLAIGTHTLRVVEDLPQELNKTVKIKKSWIPGVYYTDN